ncbi:MAG: DUF302 domain-containing protein [Chloroflexi bacterium]|nr:MAG: DUF302 domain-containing protein [Chloroflexota bacterium]
MDTTQALKALHTRLNVDYEVALEQVTAALKEEGFGVLTEIDVKDTLKKKIDVDFHRYKILGACNPPLAHQALTLAPEVGLLLPCNVTVSEAEDGVTDVSILDPMLLVEHIDKPELRTVAQEAQARLRRVIESLERA